MASGSLQHFSKRRGQDGDFFGPIKSYIFQETEGPGISPSSLFQALTQWGECEQKEGGLGKRRRACKHCFKVAYYSFEEVNEPSVATRPHYFFFVSRQVFVFSFLFISVHVFHGN